VSPDDDFGPGEDVAADLRAEPRGFAPDEMVRCEECLRANPPTRATCLYCASALPVTEQSAILQRPTLRRLENWEQGFNCILMPDEQAASLSEQGLGEAASLLRLTIEDARRIFESQEPLPLARAANKSEASLIERRLKELGLEVLTIADEELAVETKPPRRIRALELTADALVAWPTGSNDVLRASWHDVGLFVAGRIIVRQVEVEERPGRRAEKEIVATRELSADDALLDIYSIAEEGNWRIIAGNFDFSCLGQEKSLLVAGNFTRLLMNLRERAAQAAFDDSYLRLRHALNAAWPLEQQTKSRGWRRDGPGRVRTEEVTTSDNELQFTRYSRLLYYLKSGRQGKAS
jgi:hypothetical protein